MREIIEFRIVNEYAHLLLEPGEGKKNSSNTIIHITKYNPKFDQIRFLNKEIREKNNDFFFLYSNIKREYSKKELATATFFQMKIRTTFEPAGEEFGTMYNEMEACEICGSNRKQLSLLTLKKGSIPKRDISRTIAGEVVVSERFAEVLKQSSLKGIHLEPVLFGKSVSNYYQLITSSPELELTDKTVAGVNLFDFSEASEGREFTVSGHYVKFEREVYKCPRGHTIGLNLLSDAYVVSSPSIHHYDLFSSKQKLGVKRGLLRPEPLYLCSPAFREVVEKEKLSGFEFEIANIE